MTFVRAAAAVIVTVALGLVPIRASAALTLSADGNTVYDSSNNIVWLSSGDLAAKNTFGLSNCQTESVANSLPCVNTNGTMSYQSAQQWVQNMNSSDYLGHTNWQLPVSPNTDKSCSSTGPTPNFNSFGFYCGADALGSLYKQLGLSAPKPVMLPTNQTVGPFDNLQAGLYWSSTLNTNNPLVTNGYKSFSFVSGFSGSQVGDNFHFVLPMIQGQLPASTLAAYPGQTVYDPVANVTWLANADFAAANPFSLPSCAQLIASNPSLDLKDPNIFCVNSDGSMNHESALQWIADLNANGGYLGQSDWVLPPVLPSDSNCTIPNLSSPNHASPDQSTGYNCTGGTPSDGITANPFGSLFYGLLGLSQGESVLGGPVSDSVGPFSDIQPYLYWSCEGADINSQCSGEAAPGFQYSYFFGDGYQDTDILGNDLFVTAYYNAPEPISLSIFGAGLAGMLVVRRRKKIA